MNEKLLRETSLYRQFSLLEDAPRAFFEVFILYRKNQTLHRNKVIVNYGEKVQGLYLILSGSIKVKSQKNN